MKKNQQQKIIVDLLYENCTQEWSIEYNPDPVNSNEVIILSSPNDITLNNYNESLMDIRLTENNMIQPITVWYKIRSCQADSSHIKWFKTDNNWVA